MNINWISPLSTAIKRLQDMESKLSRDRGNCLNILRRALLANNSFDVDRLSDADRRAVSRIVSSIGNEQDELPEYIFEGLREHDNEWILNQIDSQKQ